MTFSEQYFQEMNEVVGRIYKAHIEEVALHLCMLRKAGGRLFCLGLGGSGAHASHAAADFRKLCGLDAYCLSDNAAGFSAMANDEGWPAAFSGLLRLHEFTARDALFVLSVGGGSTTISTPLVYAAAYAKALKGKVLGVFGKGGGLIGKMADASVGIPEYIPNYVTPHTEGLMSVVLHCLVSHPALQVQQPKWESLA